MQASPSHTSLSPLAPTPPAPLAPPHPALRTFSVKGPFGVKLTLATTVSGLLAVNFPARALSAPARMHAEPPTFTVDIDLTPPGAPSPAPTEILPCELSQEEHTAALPTLGIKVRDFAYEPRTPEIAAEIFDPITALAEYDFRLSQVPRVAPIEGRLFRRLLDIGWASQRDAYRWTAADRASLAAYDALDQKYPYRAMARPFPCPAERVAHRNARGIYIIAKEHAMRMEANRIRTDIQFEEWSHDLVDKAKEVATDGDNSATDAPMEEGEIEDPKASGSKRILDPSDSSSPTKKRRVTPTSPPPGVARQFPAPRSAYSPSLYPEMYAEDASSAPERTDTPPLERSDTPPLDDTADDTARPGRTNGLGRAQTFHIL